MATKNNPGAYDCYAHAAPDEPMFVLLARDKHAPTLIWLWAALRELDGESPAKVAEAHQCCASMLEWQATNARTSIGIGQAALAAVMELIRAANAGVRNAPNPQTDADALRSYFAQTRFEALPPKSSDIDSEQPWQRDDGATFNCTLLIGGLEHITTETIAAWSDDECRAVEEYCGAVHLHASDNDDVVIPTKPIVLIPLASDPQQAKA